jgi:hypothetical protein
MRKLLLCAMLVVLMGNSKCPLEEQNTEGTGTLLPGVDVGGVSGAAWTLSYDKNLVVTLRSGGKVASDTVALGRHSVTLLDRTIRVGDFCWRTDTICPQQVLPALTTILQPTDNQVMLDFIRRGPLAGFAPDARLLGTLDGSELSVPLATNHTLAGMCALQPRSFCPRLAWSRFLPLCCNAAQLRRISVAKSP